MTSIRKIRRRANARPTAAARRRRQACRLLLKALASLDAVIGKPRPLPPPTPGGRIWIRRYRSQP